MPILDKSDYFIEIPGHPDCVGLESGAGEWLTVTQITRTKNIHVGDYPCEMPSAEVAQRVAAWKANRMQEDDGRVGPPVVA